MQNSVALHDFLCVSNGLHATKRARLSGDWKWTTSPKVQYDIQRLLGKRVHHNTLKIESNTDSHKMFRILCTF